MLTTTSLILLTFTGAQGVPIHSLHRDEANATVALAALLRQRWHRVAGRALGDGTTVAASAEQLSDERTIALYEAVMEHVDTPDHETDTWGTEELKVELDLVAVPMTRSTALQLVGDLRGSVENFDAACAGDSNDAVEEAGREACDEASYHADMLEKALG